MSTYTMDIPLFSLYPVTIGFLLSYDKGDVIGDKIYWGDRYGTADLLQGRKGEDTLPPPIYDLVLVWV